MLHFDCIFAAVSNDSGRRFHLPAGHFKQDCCGHQHEFCKFPLPQRLYLYYTKPEQSKFDEDRCSIVQLKVSHSSQLIVNKASTSSKTSRFPLSVVWVGRKSAFQKRFVCWCGSCAATINGASHWPAFQRARSAILMFPRICFQPRATTGYLTEALMAIQNSVHVCVHDSLSSWL